MPKGPHTAALSTVAAGEHSHGIGAPAVYTEPLSAGLRLSNNNLRNLGQHGDANIEMEKSNKAGMDKNQ